MHMKNVVEHLELEYLPRALKVIRVRGKCDHCYDLRVGMRQR